MKYISKNIIPLLLLFSVYCGMSKCAMATHIVGGEVTAEYIRTVGTNWEYKISFWIYRDCDPSVTGTFDDPMNFSIFTSNDSLFRTEFINLPFNGVTTLVPYVNNPCLVTPPNICTEYALYEKNIFLPIDTGGYTVTYQRCCRNAGIVNIVNPGAVGSSFVVQIPGTNKIGSSPNTTPKFQDYPPMILCLDDSLWFDHSAAEPDGDSLVYELCTPYDGGSQTQPAPSPAFPPPYSLIPWSTGYSVNNQIAGSPSFTIDPVTGVFTGTPTVSGKFVVGICVSEYRNGVFLSRSTRDFQFTVTYCDPQSIAAASSQERFCDGLNVTFRNNSQNAWGYFWDFGDLTTTTDTSYQKEPSYTYPDTGKYIITLIANPGLTCADTVTTEYEIYETLEPFFEPPEGQCFDEHGFNLTAGGLFQQYAIFNWQFGTGAITSGSFDRNPVNVRFKEPGVYPVTLIIFENGCEESYTDTLKVYPNPRPLFDVVDRSGCAPATIEFSNTSEAWSSMTYLWDFGDGETSTEKEPIHYYPDPGVYDVILHASVSDVCTTTTSIVKEKMIKINSIPTASLYADKLITSIYDPAIQFTDVSIGGYTCQLLLGDGLKSSSCDYKHSYWNPGKYNVTQIVKTEYGCTDTNQIEVVIAPEISIFIPNTFTPNRDGKNEVFKPIGEVVLDYNFYIYDRWGKLVYHSTKLDLGWDGTETGMPAPMDTYIYHITFKDAIGVDQEYRGTFTLLR